MKKATVRVFAPATVANVAVGFDLLGFPIHSVGDTVSVTRIAEKEVRILAIRGIEALPLDPTKNTATVGLLQLLEDDALDFGFEVSIDKGIPLGSGMGGSAASSIGALVAANALLGSPLTKLELLKYALLGEAAASGSAHADNIAPGLFGGITLVRSMNPLEIVEIPAPKQIVCVLVHPHQRLDTRDSRKQLKENISLRDHVKQSANLGGFIAGCFKNDLAMIKNSLSDLIIEPQRSVLIPGFHEVKKAALESGALGCSISGSGPSVFAWMDSPEKAEIARKKMSDAFLAAGISGVDSWTSLISAHGARVIS